MVQLIELSLHRIDRSVNTAWTDEIKQTLKEPGNETHFVNFSVSAIDSTEHQSFQCHQLSTSRQIHIYTLNV